MLDHQLFTPHVITLVTTLTFIICAIAMTWTHFDTRRNARMNKATTYLGQYVAYRDGNPIIALAMFANALSGQDRLWAIHDLVTLATLNNNPDALLVIRDHISAKDLRRTLKNWSDGDPKGFIKGDPSVGQANGKKLICFAVGTRTIEHLDTELTAAEHNMLRDRFGIHQPLEVVESGTG